VTITVTDLAVGPVDEQFSSFALGNRASPVDCIALGGSDSRYTLGAFASPSPLIAVWNDVYLIIFGHIIMQGSQLRP